MYPCPCHTTQVKIGASTSAKQGGKIFLHHHTHFCMIHPHFRNSCSCTARALYCDYQPAFQCTWRKRERYFTRPIFSSGSDRFSQCWHNPINSSWTSRLLFIHFKNSVLSSARNLSNWTKFESTSSPTLEYTLFNTQEWVKSIIFKTLDVLLRTN